ELQRAGQCLQHALRDPAHVSTLEAGVVRHAHPGQDSDLLPTEPGHAATAVGAHPCLLGRDPRAAGGQELAGLLLGVHEISVNPAARLWGTLPVPLSTRTVTTRDPLLSWTE